MTTTITNRELLRNYREIKTELIQGRVKTVEIEQKNGYVFVLEMKKKRAEKTPFQKLLEDIKANPVTGVKRPSADLYDYL